MISGLSVKKATWDKIQTALILEDKIQQKKELQWKLKYLQTNLASVHRPLNIRSDLPLEKNKLRSTDKLPLLPGILTYFHYDNMICVCVNARGEAAESWRRAPLPLGPGRMPEAWAQLFGSAHGVIHFHKQIHSDIKKRRSGALVSKVFTVSTRQLLHKGLFICWISKLVPVEGVENIWAILGFSLVQSQKCVLFYVSLLWQKLRSLHFCFLLPLPRK